MRVISVIALAVSLYACTTERVVAPREYLDERSAATITVVKEPWIFTRESPSAGSGRQRDFLQLYAMDVNRMGEHKQYIAALHSFAPHEAADVSALPTLKLNKGSWSMTLRASMAPAEEIGIVQPVADSYALDAAWLYFPVDKEALATIANTPDLEAEIISGGERTVFVVWRDGREELSELTAVLP